MINTTWQLERLLQRVGEGTTTTDDERDLREFLIGLGVTVAPFEEVTPEKFGEPPPDAC